MTRALRIEEAVSLQWEIDLTLAQRLALCRVAGVPESSAQRSYAWSRLRGDERDAITRAAICILELAEQLSGDLSG